MNRAAKIIQVLYYSWLYRRYLTKDRAYIETLQLKKIREVLAAAFQIPFYREKYAKAGIHASDIKTLEDFEKLPVLTKEELRDAYLAKGLLKDRNDGRWFSTTGSTGSSVKVFMPQKKTSQEIAIATPIFAGAFLRLLWIEKFNRIGIGPNCLSFFKPDSMFFKIRFILGVIPLKQHGDIVFCCIYNVNCEQAVPFLRKSMPKKKINSFYLSQQSRNYLILLMNFNGSGRGWLQPNLASL